MITLIFWNEAVGLGLLRFDSWAEADWFMLDFAERERNGYAWRVEK